MPIIADLSAELGISILFDRVKPNGAQLRPYPDDDKAAQWLAANGAVKRIVEKGEPERYPDLSPDNVGRLITRLLIQAATVPKSS